METKDHTEGHRPQIKRRDGLQMKTLCIHRGVGGTSHSMQKEATTTLNADITTQHSLVRKHPFRRI